MSASALLQLEPPWVAGESPLADRIGGWLRGVGIEPSPAPSRCWLVVGEAVAAERLLAAREGEGPVAGTLVIDASAGSAEAARARACRLAEAGVETVDTVFLEAADGALVAVACAGSEQACDRAAPLLDALARGGSGDSGTPAVRVRAGASGASRVALEAHRIIVAGTAQAVAEAMALAGALQADVARVAAAMAGGFAASQVLTDLGPASRSMGAGDPPGRSGPTVGRCARALGEILDEAHARGCALPLTSVIAQQLNALVGSGQTQADLGALREVLARMRSAESLP